MMQKSHKNLYKWIKFLLGFFLPLSAWAQHPLDSSDMYPSQFLWENIVEQNAEDIDFTDYQLLFNQNNIFKRKINEFSKTDLLKIPFLTAEQINQFLTHKQQSGGFISPLELQSLPTWGDSIYHQFLKYLPDSNTLIDKLFYSPFSIIPQTKFQFISRVNIPLFNPLGFGDEVTYNNRFLGQRFGLYHRLAYQYNPKLKVGFTAENDLGEPLFSPKQPTGYDFYSGYIQYQQGKNTLVIGDYLASFGQGVQLYQGFFLNRNIESIRLMKIGEGISPYRSANENRFLRGMAFNHKLTNKFSITSFISRKKSDANVEEDSSGKPLYYSALYIDGLHRTQTELSRKNKIEQTVLGADVQYKFQKGSIGLLTSGGYNNIGKLNSGNAIFNTPQNDTFANASIYHDFYHKNIRFFGELTTDRFSQIAYLQGLTLSLSKKLDMTIISRRYPSAYFAPFGQSFSSANTPKNERGTYVALRYEHNKFQSVRVFVDYFNRDYAINNRITEPTAMAEYWAEWIGKISPKEDVCVRIRVIDRNTRSVAVPNLTYKHSQNFLYRIQYNYLLNKNLNLLSRLEINQHNNTATNNQGFLFFQEVHKKSGFDSYRWAFRLSYYHVMSQETRVFAYENDVLSSFSIVPFSGTGYRASLLFGQKLNKLWQLQVKSGYNYQVTTLTTTPSPTKPISPHQPSLTLQLICSW